MGIAELDLVIEDRFRKVQEGDAAVYRMLNVEHGAHILGAVRNTLLTLSHIVHADSKGNLEVHATATGIAGLLRIGLEGLANFKWLSEPGDDTVLEARAFGVHFKQVSEAQKYYRDLGDTLALAKFTRLLENEITHGISKGFLEERPEKLGTYRCVGLANIPDTTSLCRAIKVPKEIVSDELKATYSGLDNSVFLYRWLSGNTHGMFWVNSFEKQDDGKSMPKIPYWILSLSLGTSLAEIRSLAQQI